MGQNQALDTVRAVTKLEEKLQFLWDKVKRSQRPDEVVKAREEALKVYRELKKTKSFLGVV